MDKKVKLILGVTTLGYSKNTVDCLLELANGHFLTGWAIPDACLIPHCRNKVVELARQNCPDYTHLIFIDDDMAGFSKEHVVKLVNNTILIENCDICSALVTMRKPPYKLVAQFSDCSDKDVYDFICERKVVESTHVGMAFTVIKREVLDAVEEQTEDGSVWFTLDRPPRATYELELADYTSELVKQVNSNNIDTKGALLKAAAFGENAHRGSRLLGEDIEFCVKARRMGYKMWVDCGVSVGHLGLVGFDFRHAFAEADRLRAMAAASDAGVPNDGVLAE